MKKFFLYARKSSDAEDRQILSIEAQLTELREYLQSKVEDSIIVEEFTEARTAKEPGRPILNKMISRIEKGEAEGILAWHPDRLARNSVDGGKIIHLIDRGLVKLLEFPTYRFDNTAQGKFMLNIIFGQSKYYVDNLSENVKRGVRQKLRRGEWPSYAPIGYSNNLKTKKIEIDSERGPKIKKLFELFSTGQYNLREMVSFATSMDLLGRESGNQLTKWTISKLLKNPIYYGFIRYTGELFEGKHEPLISKELFNKVQEAMRGKLRPKKIKHKFIFRGLIRCSICGGTITAETQKGFHYYRCTKKIKDKPCNLKYLREEDLVVQINKKLKKIIVSEDVICYLKSQIPTERKTLSDSVNKEIISLNKKVAELETKISRLMDLYLEQEIAKNEFARRKEILIDEKYKFEKNLNFLKRGQFIWLERLEEFINGLMTTKTVFESDDFQTKREYLEKIGSNFTLGPIAAPNRAETPEISGQNPAGGFLKNVAATGKNSVRLDFEFKNLWLVLVEQTKKAAGESVAFYNHLLWRRVRDLNSRAGLLRPTGLANPPLRPLE